MNKINRIDLVAKDDKYQIASIFNLGCHDLDKNSVGLFKSGEDFIASLTLVHNKDRDHDVYLLQGFYLVNVAFEDILSQRDEILSKTASVNRHFRHSIQDLQDLLGRLEQKPESQENEVEKTRIKSLIEAKKKERIESLEKLEIEYKKLKEIENDTLRFNYKHKPVFKFEELTPSILKTLTHSIWYNIANVPRLDLPKSSEVSASRGGAAPDL